MSEGSESEIIERWKARGQDHLFEFWAERSPEKKKVLLDDLDSLNVDVYELLQQQLEQKLEGPGRRHIEPIAHIPEKEWREDSAARRHVADEPGVGGGQPIGGAHVSARCKFDSGTGLERDLPVFDRADAHLGPGEVN